MNADIKEKWITALQSGEYPKTKFMLRRTADWTSSKIPEGYCCLGVLCDIYQKETGNGKWISDGFGFPEPIPVAPDPHDAPESLRIWCSALPPYVQHWAGLPDANPTVDLTPTRIESLAEINDRTDTFAIVIDAIEQGL